MAQLVVGKSNLSYRRPYLNPLLSLDQLVKSARQALQTKLKRWAGLVSGSKANDASGNAGPKNYAQPEARKVMLEQARLLALGSVGMNDEESAFMQLLFPGGPLPGERLPEQPRLPSDRQENLGAPLAENLGAPLAVDEAVQTLR